MTNYGLIILGWVILSLGIWALVQPRALLDWVVQFWAEGRRIALVVTLRVLLGLYLIVIAPTTRVPEVAFSLGALFLLAAAIVVFLGSERLARLLAWWVARPNGQIRLLGPLWGAFGVLFLWLAT